MPDIVSMESMNIRKINNGFLLRVSVKKGFPPNTTWDDEEFFFDAQNKDALALKITSLLSELD
jgi:hypothetical protein